MTISPICASLVYQRRPRWYVPILANQGLFLESSDRVVFYAGFSPSLGANGWKDRCVGRWSRFLYVMNTATGSATKICPLPHDDDKFHRLRDCGDGRHVALVTGRGNLICVDVLSGRLDDVFVQGVPSGELWDVVVHRSGRVMAAVTGRTSAVGEPAEPMTLHLGAGQALQLPGFPGWSYADWIPQLLVWNYEPRLFLSPDGRTLVVQCDRYPQNILVLDLANSDHRAWLRLEADVARLLCISNRIFVSVAISRPSGESAEYESWREYMAWVRGEPPPKDEPLPSVGRLQCWKIVESTNGLEVQLLWTRTFEDKERYRLLSTKPFVARGCPDLLYVFDEDGYSCYDLRGQFRFRGKLPFNIACIVTDRDGGLRWVVDSYGSMFPPRLLDTAVTERPIPVMEEVAWTSRDTLVVGGYLSRFPSEGSADKAQGYWLRKIDIARRTELARAFIPYSTEDFHIKSFYPWGSGVGLLLCDEVTGSLKLRVIDQETRWAWLAELFDPNTGKPQHGNLFPEDVRHYPIAEKVVNNKWYGVFVVIPRRGVYRLVFREALADGTIKERCVSLVPDLVVPEGAGDVVACFVETSDSIVVRAGEWLLFFNAEDYESPRICALPKVGGWSYEGSRIVAWDDLLLSIPENMNAVMGIDWREGTVRWKVSTSMEEIGNRRRHMRIVSYAVNRDRMMFLGMEDGTVSILNAETGSELLRIAAHEEPVHVVAPGPDNLLATGARDGTIRVWRLLHR